MTRNKSIPLLPDLSDRKVVGRHLERLDTTGVSRRDFLALASAGAAAAAGASALGLPNVAVAAPSGKLATGATHAHWPRTTRAFTRIGSSATSLSTVPFPRRNGASDCRRRSRHSRDWRVTITGKGGSLLPRQDGPVTVAWDGDRGVTVRVIPRRRWGDCPLIGDHAAVARLSLRFYGRHELSAFGPKDGISDACLSPLKALIHIRIS